MCSFRVHFAPGPLADLYETKVGHPQHEGQTAIQRRSVLSQWPIDLTPHSIRMLEAEVGDICQHSIQRLKRRQVGPDMRCLYYSCPPKPCVAWPSSVTTNGHFCCTAFVVTLQSGLAASNPEAIGVLDSSKVFQPCHRHAAVTACDEQSQILTAGKQAAKSRCQLSKQCTCNV